jgi:hypothetical protein
MQCATHTTTDAHRTPYSTGQRVCERVRAVACRCGCVHARARVWAVPSLGRARRCACVRACEGATYALIADAANGCDGICENDFGRERSLLREQKLHQTALQHVACNMRQRRASAALPV